MGQMLKDLLTGVWDTLPFKIAWTSDSGRVCVCVFVYVRGQGGRD